MTHKSRRLIVAVALAGAALVVTGGAVSSRKQALPDRVRALNPDAPVYALVELYETAAAPRFHDQLRVRGKAVATRASIDQLGRIKGEQAAFAQRVQDSKIAGAKELYRLQRVFNGVVYLTTASGMKALGNLPGVKSIMPIQPKTLLNAYSMPFLGVPSAAWAATGLGLHGETIKVGVIDTGVDYMHANFGGSGLVADYTANDPLVVETGSFPTAKVVGGWDFAGKDYDAGVASLATPVPDPDPMDYHGHGSHVAGTIAGFGVNADGTTYTGTYDVATPLATMKIGPGAAPKAELYALKVFGDVTGSTSVDALAVEWSVDPNGDGDFSDHLDVINLSLGGAYGTSTNAEAAIYRGAVQAGVVVVTAAGNAQDVYFVTGAPSTTPEVISVAATQHDHTMYSALRINAPASLAGDKLAGLGSDAAPATPALTADVVAADPLTACDAAGAALINNPAALAGKIALVRRGTCTFTVKADAVIAAGAIGLIIVNNAAGSPPAMTITSSVPVRSVTNVDGAAIIAALATDVVNVTMDDALMLAKPEEADDAASFTSRGPSRIKGQVLLKPDLATPGYGIISTKVGSGTEAVSMSGTSMACPLAAGFMALLKQAHPTWTPAELKALAMSTAIHDVYLAPGTTTRPRVSPARAGAGRVDAVAALATSVFAYDKDHPERVSVSFATTDVAKVLTETRTVTLRNTGATDVTYTVAVDPSVTMAGTSVTVTSGASVTVPAGGTADVTLVLSADPAAMARARDATTASYRTIAPYGNLYRNWLSETSGYVTFVPTAGSTTNLRLPFFAALNPASEMKAAGPVVPTAMTGTATLGLAGTGIDTSALPNGVFSLATAFELMHASADEAPLGSTLPAGYDQAEANPSDIRYVGVTSDLPDTGSLAAGSLYFALVSHGMWGSPNEVEYDVYLKRKSAANWEYVLLNYDLGVSAAAQVYGNDAQFAYLYNLTDGSFNPVTRVNGVEPNWFYLPMFMTDTMVLQVAAADIGLTDGDSEIEFMVATWSANLSGLIDNTPTLRYDPARPAFATKIDTNVGFPAGWSIPPWQIDMPGVSVPVTYDLQRAVDTQAGGILLVHHLNGAGLRGELVPVQYITCTADADCVAPTQFCDATSGICMGCRTTADCRSGEICDAYGTRTCVAECRYTDSNKCAAGAYCNGADGKCVADCRYSGAEACLAHHWCDQASGMCIAANALAETADEPAGAVCAAGGVWVRTGIDDDNDGVLDTAEIASEKVICNGLSQRIAVTDEPAGANCTYGGKKVETGLDRDNDGLLQAVEVDTTSYVCNGEPGKNSLVKVTDVQPGGQCAAGGQLVQSGVDDNADGVLDDAEVDDTGLFCNGIRGPSTLVSVTTEAAGANCAAGGKKIDTGADDNGDGVLQAAEVDATSYVCNGQQGHSTLAVVTDEAAGTNCAAGGKKVQTGTDLDSDGTLDAAEVTATSYVCNGVSGHSTLVAVVDEAAGDNCPFGGKKIETGLDLDDDGVLATTEVQKTSYVCSPEPLKQPLTVVSDEAAGDNCAAGGKKIEMGLDTDGDGALDPDEVENTSYLCNGTNGVDGEPGATGETGAQGKAGIPTLSKTSKVEKGYPCEKGGIQVVTGPDNNGNGVLDDIEVTGSSFVCNDVGGGCSTSGGGASGWSLVALAGLAFALRRRRA